MNKCEDAEKDEKIDLDYRNMLAVCSGNRGCGNEKSLTCDSRKGNQIIHVNPCDANTLQGIEYSSDGRIKSANQDIDRELNEVLNLNCEGVSLPQNRKSELDELLNKIKRECSGGDFKAYCKKKLSQIQEKPDPKIPYVGILIWWLEKHVRR